MLLFHFFGKLLFLAFAGFVVLLLIGPVLAALSVLLPFVAVGLLVWGAHLLVRRAGGCPRQWVERHHEVRRVVFRGMQHAGHRAWTCGARAAEAAPVVVAGARRAGERVRAHGWFVCRFLWEVACGSLVGVTLGALAGRQTGCPAEYAVLGGLVGTVLGMIVGGSRWEPVRPAGVEWPARPVQTSMFPSSPPRLPADTTA